MTMSRPQVLLSAYERAATAVAAVRRRVDAPMRTAVRPMTALGWTVAATAFGGWVLGWLFGWAEFMVIATTALILLVVCLALTAGRTKLAVEVEVDPRRLTVGAAATGQVTVTNLARGVLLPLVLEVPIGASGARFLLPAMPHQSQQQELFVVPTQRRGVIVIGPATTVRGDPLGIARRTVSWTQPIELFVHPLTVPLEPLGSGLLRDLDGQTTNDVSMSDLAFHALRDYTPGDDRRYIHWRSSAKAGRFLVRQFLDTRRSHVAVLVDSDVASYADPDHYETAISAGASVAVRVLRDEQDLTVLAGAHALPDAAGPTVLDVFSRAELADHGLNDLAGRAAKIAPDISIALLVTGSALPFHEVEHAATHFPPEVRIVALHVDPSAPTALTGTKRLTVLRLNALSDLAVLMNGAF
jgi:uncharacterized protein (DUF58 family)